MPHTSQPSKNALAQLPSQNCLDMSDCVFIQGLKVDAIIGVYEWEQAITQPLVYDVEIFTSHASSSQTDNISDAINYKSVCERIAELSLTSKVALLERMAQLVADMILEEFAANEVIVTIHKPTAIKNAQSVGVKIYRSNTANLSPKND